MRRAMSWRRSTASFNPCFNGSVERGVRADSLESGPVRVSILVLMEVLREGPQKRRARRQRRCFNPCFNGSVERGGWCHSGW